MKSLTIHTLFVAVALAMALLGTPSMAASAFSGPPLSQSDKHTTSASPAPSPASCYALNRLDAETLAAQEMTDQELKSVEGGWSLAMFAYPNYVANTSLSGLACSGSHFDEATLHLY